MSPPSGTVTFLFTDIEGSTRLWEEHPEAMRVALARHDDILRGAFERHGGHVFKTVGDAFCVAFASAPEALRAAMDAQRALRQEAWGEVGSVRVRMALHAGEAQERDADYFGPALNRVARLLAAGRGEQVLLSRAAREGLELSLPEAVTLHDMGSHRLKDLLLPEHVYQLVHPELPAEFPPLRSLDALPNNLPRQLTSFIGREREMAEVKRLLSVGSLVTLTGPGGTGKTRLALQVGADLLDRYGDGVWLADLAPLTDAPLVPQAVASALGLRDEPGRPLTQTLTDFLASKSLLLVLDNCEHLIEACAQLAAALLAASPRLSVLATSREPLRVPGEVAWPVPSLPLPDPALPLPPPENLERYDAVRLFRERAVSVQPGFAITSKNAHAVAQICRRLDGIPLAVELAAARVRALPVEQIAPRLDDRFRLLTGGSRTALPRQQTLRALIDWSWDLLNAGEKALLSRLSVFSGGWTLDAAEAVCAGGEVEGWEVLDLLTGLVDKSLAVYEDPEGGARYRLLETVRQYARDRLGEAGEEGAVKRQHRDFYLALSEEAEPFLRGQEQVAWFGCLEAEKGNLRAALEYCFAEAGPGGDGRALRFVAALWWFWYIRGYSGEGRANVEKALSGTGPLESGERPTSPARAKALQAAGSFAYQQGDPETARARWQECLEVRRAQEDKRGVAAVLNNLGVLARDRGDFGEARSRYEEALALRREVGHAPDIAGTLNNLALLMSDRGDAAAAQALYEESLSFLRQDGDTYAMATTLNNLGKLAHERNDHVRARAYIEEALALRRQIGEKRGVAMSLVSLGTIAQAQGHDDEARSLFEQALVICQETGDQWLTSFTLEGLASLAAERGDYGRADALYRESLRVRVTLGDRPHIAHTLHFLGRMRYRQGLPGGAARLWAAAEALREATGAVLHQTPESCREEERSVAAARSALGEASFADAWAEGRAMPLEQAVEYALKQEG